MWSGTNHESSPSRSGSTRSQSPATSTSSPRRISLAIRNSRDDKVYGDEAMHVQAVQQAQAQHAAVPVAAAAGAIAHAPPTAHAPQAPPAAHAPPSATRAAHTSAAHASLDTLKGYAPSHAAPVAQHGTPHPGGDALLRDPLHNKGTSFAPSARIAGHLTGLVPHTLESLDMQCARAMRVIESRGTNIDKYMYLSSLKATNIDLFYRLLIDNITTLMPLVYTPTIGDVCLQYSTLYTRPEALYISILQKNSIRTMLRNWPTRPAICVVTDGSRILGLGDQGINGVGISIGKLALYVGAAGIHPAQTMPIVLDCGTDNADHLRDPLYLGLRRPRVPRAEADAFMAEFMAAVRDVYPEMLVQFEDFETTKAFDYLAKYKDQRCFNDDIQGTGAVVLAGYINAAELSGVPLEDQRVVFMGAGSAGVGVAKQLLDYYTRRGLSEEQAKDKFYLVDTSGLVTADRGRLAAHKKYFARTDNGGHQFGSLEAVIEYAKPTALIGLTATHGVFNESIVRALKMSVEAGGSGRRPILFPLSNPLTKAECTFQQAIQWTDGTVIFGSGSPFAPVQAGNRIFSADQANNCYVFPGIGMGAMLARASRVTDEMIYASSEALAASLNPTERAEGRLYPELRRVREASVVVAREVMKCARRQGVSEVLDSQWREWEEWGDVSLDRWIRAHVYDPREE